jgi:hypothetical protein
MRNPMFSMAGMMRLAYAFALVATVSVVESAKAEDGFSVCSGKVGNDSCRFDDGFGVRDGFCCKENEGRLYCFEDACPSEAGLDGPTQDGGSNDGGASDGGASDGSANDDSANDDGASGDDDDSASGDDDDDSASGDDDDDSNETSGDTDSSDSSGCSASNDAGSPGAAAVSGLALALGAVLVTRRRRK